MDFPLTPFFCVVKIRLKKSARDCVAVIAEAETALKGCWPMKNWRSRRRKEWRAVSAPNLQYSVFSWPEEEEERNPVQVADCLLAVGAALVGGIQGLEDGDGDGADSCWWGILFEVSGELPAQPKVKLDQLVVPGVFGPHRYKYFPYGTKVLFHGTLLDGCSSGFQKVGAHALGEDIEETYGIPDVLEVGWDLHPLAELAPLAPGGGVFLEECGR